jgi:hypothetical protein
VIPIVAIVRACHAPHWWWLFGLLFLVHEGKNFGGKIRNELREKSDKIIHQNCLCFAAFWSIICPNAGVFEKILMAWASSVQ